jgi:anti-sigma28 factor (negative regulator of flagellin synthesis)
VNIDIKKITKQLKIMQEKYKSAKSQVEKYKKSNRELKNSSRIQNSGRNERLRSVSRHRSTNSNRNMNEINKLETIIRQLKSDVNYHQMTAQDFRLRLDNLQKNNSSRNIEKRYETEKSKNIFLENENMRLQKQIREINSKYKISIDDRNRSTIHNFVNRKKSTSVEISKESRNKIFELQSENRKLKEKLEMMNNEFKKNLQLVDTMTSNENELQDLRNQISQLKEENQVLIGNKANLEIRIKMLQDSLNNKNSEFQTTKQGSDHLVQMYQKLYNDMKNECEIYMNKVEEMRRKIQNGNYDSNTMSFTKKVYQGKQQLNE